MLLPFHCRSVVAGQRVHTVRYDGLLLGLSAHTHTHTHTHTHSVLRNRALDTAELDLVEVDRTTSYVLTLTQQLLIMLTQCSTVQFSTVECSTAQCSAGQYSTVYNSLVQFRTAHCSTVEYSGQLCSGPRPELENAANQAG